MRRYSESTDHFDIPRISRKGTKPHQQDLIVRDVRVEGARPAGREVLEVDENTPLDWPISWLAARAKVYGGHVRARIIAHGAGAYVGNVVVEREVDGNYGFQDPPVSAGGGGIWLCKDGIFLRTIPKFLILRGKLEQIDLLSCGAAYITPGFEGKDGDGNFLCSRLAQITQAFVRASTAFQEYNGHGPIDLGRWEGVVLTYGPTGGVVKVENSPSN